MAGESPLALHQPALIIVQCSSMLDFFGCLGDSTKSLPYRSRATASQPHGGPRHCRTPIPPSPPKRASQPLTGAVCWEVGALSPTPCLGAERSICFSQPSKHAGKGLSHPTLDLNSSSAQPCLPKKPSQGPGHQCLRC